jgi:hypothetical protein
MNKRFRFVGEKVRIAVMTRTRSRFASACVYSFCYEPPNHHNCLFWTDRFCRRDDSRTVCDRITIIAVYLSRDRWLFFFDFFSRRTPFRPAKTTSPLKHVEPAPPPYALQKQRQRGFAEFVNHPLHRARSSQPILPSVPSSLSQRFALFALSRAGSVPTPRYSEYNNYMRIIILYTCVAYKYFNICIRLYYKTYINVSNIHICLWKLYSICVSIPCADGLNVYVYNYLSIHKCCIRIIIICTTLHSNYVRGTCNAHSTYSFHRA